MWRQWAALCERYVKLKCNLEIDEAAGFAKPRMPVRFQSWPPTKSNT